jgi:hypothetical protein
VSEKLYYLQDTRQVIGNCALWWRKNCSGYTVNLDEANTFTKSQAYAIHNVRNTDVPRLISEINKIAKLHVNVKDIIG